MKRKQNRNCNEGSEILYKFLSISNFKRFVEILVNNRLYGARYAELNDPMECAFVRSGSDIDGYLYQQLKHVRICSFMTVDGDQSCNSIEPFNDMLMWSHYADGHNGVCLELEYTRAHNNDWKRCRVEYNDELPKVSGNKEQDIYNILSSKAKIWEQENEVRYIRIYRDDKSFENNSPYLHIKLKSVYIGKKVKGNEAANLCKLIRKINQDICVFWMQKRKDEFTYSGFVPRNLIDNPIKQ